MAEYLMNIAEEDRWEKMNARTNAVFGEIMAKLEILLQLSSHGATNSSEEISTLEPPLNVNLPIQDEIRSSAKQIEVPTEPKSNIMFTRFDGEIDASKSVNETLLVSDTIVPSMTPIANHFVTKDTALPASDAFLPFLESIEEPESVCETKMVKTVTLTCDFDDDVGKLGTTGSFLEIHGTTTKKERQFTKIGSEVTLNESTNEMILK